MVLSWYDTEQCRSGLHNGKAAPARATARQQKGKRRPRPAREVVDGPVWTAAAVRPAVIVQRKPPVPVMARPRPAARPLRRVPNVVPVPATPPLDERALKQQFDTIFSGEPPPPATPTAARAAATPPTPQPLARSPRPTSARAAQTTERLHREAAARRKALDAKPARAATHDEAGAPLFTPRLTPRWRPTTPQRASSPGPPAAVSPIPAASPPPAPEPDPPSRLDPSPTSVSTPKLEASATRLSPAKTAASTANLETAATRLTPAKTTPRRERELAAKTTPRRRPAPVKMATAKTPPPTEPSPRQMIAPARRNNDAASIEHALVAACRARDDGEAGEAAAIAGVVAQHDVAFLCLVYRRWGAVGPDLGGGACDDESAWGERAAWAVWAAAELDAAKETVAVPALARRLVAQRAGPAEAFAAAAVRHGAALVKARAEERARDKLVAAVLPFAPSFTTPAARRHALAARANARSGAVGLPFADAARVKAERAQVIIAEKRVECARREADECTFSLRPPAKPRAARESITPVARAKPPQGERPPPPPPPPPPRRDEVELSEHQPIRKRDVEVDLGFVRVRLAASDEDDLPALVDAAATAHGLDGAQQDRLLVSLAAAVLG